MNTHSDPLNLGIATPERVSLELPVAGIGSRTGAYLIDAALIFFFWITLYFAASLVAQVDEVVLSLSGLAQTLAVIGLFATQWVFWTACEVFWNGQTPGKRIVGIRVVREDGSPVGFFESAVRNLLRFIDFLPMLYAAGVLSMLVTKQNRRLGDIAAGTLLVRQEKIDLDRYTRAETTPAAVGAVALSSRDTELILSFLERAPSLAPEARTKLASGLVAKYGAGLGDEERSRVLSSWPDTEAFLRARIG